MGKRAAFTFSCLCSSHLIMFVVHIYCIPLSKTKR